MLIIGCDFHTRYQQIAMTDGATGELERRLDHENREANRFYPGSSGCRGTIDPAPSGRTGRRPGPAPKTPYHSASAAHEFAEVGPHSFWGLLLPCRLGFTDKCWYSPSHNQSVSLNVNLVRPNICSVVARFLPTRPFRTAVAAQSKARQR